MTIDGLLLGFVVFFVLTIACVCALMVVRMLGNMKLPDNPPWPHVRARVRRDDRISARRTRHSAWTDLDFTRDVRSVKKSCIHIAHPDGKRLIPFDTFNMFYRGELETTRLAALREQELAAVW
jgi:hypothetical protein